MNRETAYRTDDPFPRGAGYFYFTGVLQIGAGVLNLLFSLLGFLQARAAGVGGLLEAQGLAEWFSGRGLEGSAAVIAGLVAFQIAFGWIFGLLLIAAGICSLKCRARGFVWFSTVVNLFNFPHGTTVALMTWHGLNRRGIARAFRSSPIRA